MATGIELATAYISIVPETSKIAPAIRKQFGTADKVAADSGKRMGKQLSSGIAPGLKSVGRAIAGTFAAVGVANFAKGVVGAASDAQQSLGATESVFKQFSDTVVATSKRAAQQYGLSAHEYRENANLIGSLFKNQGVPMRQLAGEADNMIAKASDLAATFGGSTKEAVEALGSAFKGEFNPMERYGVSLRQSVINAEAYRLANVKSESQFKKLSSAQQDSAKRQAAVNLIMKQSKDSAGAFRKEASTLAGQQQRLAAQWEDTKASLGKVFLPLITSVAEVVNNRVIPAIRNFGIEFKAGEGIAGKFRVVLEAVGDVLGTVFDFIRNNKTVVATFVTVIGAAAVATGIWSAAVAVLNAVMAANPIGLVVVAVAALAAGLVYAYKKSETFRGIVDTTWSALKVLGGFIRDTLGPIFSAWWEGMKKVGGWLGRTFVPVLQGIGDVLVDIWDLFEPVRNAFVDAIKAMTKALGPLADALKEILSLWSRLPGQGPKPKKFDPTDIPAWKDAISPPDIKPPSTGHDGPGGSMTPSSFRPRRAAGDTPNRNGAPLINIERMSPHNYSEFTVEMTRRAQTRGIGGLG